MTTVSESAPGLILPALRRIVKVAAQEELMPLFAEAERHYKSDGSIVTEADFAIQRRLIKDLSVLAPQYLLLGEEMKADEQSELIKRGDGGLWCLDPLDGTSNFAAGIPFFAVSIALLVNRELILGVTYDPVRDECFSALAGSGAWINGSDLRCRPAGLALGRALAVVDFKRLDEPLAMALVVRPPYSSHRSFGSVALEWCWLAAGRFHVYLHGRQKLWDYAAGSLILSEAGGSAETLTGESVFAPRLDARSVVAAGDESLFADWRGWVSARCHGASGEYS